MCLVRLAPPSAKVESSRLLSSFSLLPLVAAALPGKPPGPHRSTNANACIASDRRFHGPSSCAAPVLCSRRPTAAAKSRQPSQDERVVKIGKNWDGRPNRRLIRRRSCLSRRPTTKENQKPAAFGQGPYRPPSRTVPPTGTSTSEESGFEFRFWTPNECSIDLLIDLLPPSL